MRADDLAAARADVAPYVQMTAQERFAALLDVVALAEAALDALPAEQRRRALAALDALDDPGRWWERVPR